MPNTPELHFLVLNKNQSLEVPVGQQVTIGRDLTNDLVLQDKEVSRSHAIIYHPETQEGAGPLSIKDLNSLNGIFLNGQRIEAAELKPGDELILGGTLMVLAPSTDVDFEEALSSLGKRILKRIGSPKPFKRATVESLSVAALVKLGLRQLQEGSRTGIWSQFATGTLLMRLVELAQEKSPEKFYDVLLETARAAVGADGGVVMLSDPHDQQLWIRSITVAHRADPTVVISQNLVRLVMKGRKAIYSEDVASDDRFLDLADKGASRPNSLLAIPLEAASGGKAENSVQGFLYLDSMKAEVKLNQNGLMLLALFLRPALRLAPGGA